MKVEVKAARFMGRIRPGMFTAKFGRWEHHSGSRQMAEDLLVERINDAHDHMLDRAYLVTPKATFVLFWADGWAYDMVKPDGSYSTCMMNRMPKSEALKRMEAHAKEYNELEPTKENT